MVRNDPTCLMPLRSEQIQLRLMDLPKVLGRQDLRLFLWSRSTVGQRRSSRPSKRTNWITSFLPSCLSSSEACVRFESEKQQQIRHGLVAFCMLAARRGLKSLCVLCYVAGAGQMSAAMLQPSFSMVFLRPATRFILPKIAG